MTAEIEDRTYVEASRDGAVMVELDRHGYALRVQIEPQVTADWTAGLLGERLVRLYTAALMRARCDERAQMNARGADMAPTAVYPDAEEVAAYRARHLNF